MKYIFKNNFYFVLFILFVIPILLPLVHRGFPVTDDGNWMIIRLSGFFQSLKDGQFPVRFIGRLNHEYGYPVSNFLYPGYLYVGSFFHVLGFNFVDSIKVLLATCIIVGGFFCFLWLRRFFSDSSAFVGSLFYIYSPYLLFDLYSRGSVGEVLALTLIPILLYAIERQSLVFSSVVTGCLIVSHNILALLFIPIIGLYILLHKKRMFSSIIMGFLLASFFWIPAISDLQHVRFTTSTISDWSKYFIQDSTLIGIPLILVILAGIYVYVKKKNFLGIFFLITTTFSLFISSPLSTVLWSTFPIGKYIQFPWRFLSLTVPSGAYLAAYVLANLKRHRKIYILFLSVIVFFLFAGAKARLNLISYNDEADSYYSTNDDTTTINNEYMPIYVLDDPQNRPEMKIQLIGDGEVIKQRSTTRIYDVSIMAAKGAMLQFNTIYFPGWEASIDGIDIPIHKNENGLMQVRITKPGISSIHLEYKQTGIHIVSNTLSIISFGFLGLLYWYDWRKQKNNE